MDQDKIRHISQQRTREMQRHGDALRRLSAERALAQQDKDPIKRGLKLRKVVAKVSEEANRHRDKMATISRRLRDARTK